MTRLSPCPSCARHVRASEGACPFCDVALPAVTLAPVRARSLSRGHAFALGVALSVSLSACTPTPDDEAADDTTSGGETGADLDQRTMDPNTPVEPTQDPSDTSPPPDDVDPGPVAAYGAPAPP